MRKIILFVAVCGLAFVGCAGKDLKEQLAGTWQLADMEADPSADAGVGEDLLTTAAQRSDITSGYIISFFPDGSFTEIKGKGGYRQGTWKKGESNNEVILSDAQKTEKAKIVHGNLNGQELLNLKFPDKKMTLKFASSAAPLKNYREDPFYPENNKWRIKPATAEDSAALKERLANYFGHDLYVLKASKERKSDVVSFTFSQGIIKIYNGGIGIQSSPNVPRNWIDGYYNEEDAFKAYKMFDEYLQSSRYRGARTGDWMEDDYNILLGIYADFKGTKPNASPAH